MIDRQQYAYGPASALQLRRLWSAHLDTLDRHLSANMWALVAAIVVLITYPIAAIVVPDVLHNVVPDVVRTVLHLI